jgi:polygalacturonase
VENIFYRDITMRNIKKEAIVLRSNYGGWAASRDRDATNYPTFRNITIKNIVCDGAAKAVNIRGTVQKAVENVTLENVSIKAREGMTFDWVHNLNLTNVTTKIEDK